MPDYVPGWHHRLLCSYLDKFIKGEITRLIINLPPRHGKSELASCRLPALLLGQNPNLKILACSHTASLASAINRKVQRILDSASYRRLFPATTLSDHKRTRGTVEARNSDLFEVVGHSGVYRSAGVGGAIVGHGFDVGIIDDPIKSREEADSATVRESIWAWYTGDFYTRRSAGSRILVISTRWHQEDLTGKLLAASEDTLSDQWTVLRLPAIREEDSCPEDPRQIGEALWPERYPLEELAKTKAINSYDWDSQYQQRPRSPGSTEWPDSVFSRPGFWFDEWPPLDQLVVRTAALDPSKGSDAKNSDWQALVLHGRTRDGVEYVEADLARRPIVAARSSDGTPLSEGMVEAIVDKVKQFRPHGFAVEANQFQFLLRIPFETEAKRQQCELPLCLVQNHDPKVLRIRRLGTALSQGKIRFRTTPGTRLLVDQLRQFPTGAYDDGPDALEMARRLSVELWNKAHAVGPNSIVLRA
jgi:hypothetical protein